MAASIKPLGAATEAKPRKFYPIAPDGYIPNSVVRKSVNYRPPPDVQKDTWTLKPVPKQVTFLEKDEEEAANASDARSSSSLKTKVKTGEDQKSSLNPKKMRRLTDQSSTPFIFEQEEDQVNDSDSHVTSTENEAEGKTQKFSRPSPKPQQTKGRAQQNAPTSQKAKIKSGKPGRKQPDFSITEEDEDDCHPLLKQITSEQWFPKNSPQTVDNVVNCFAAFMGNVDDSVHTAICSYIVQIHRERDLGYTSGQKKKLVDKLKEQLTHTNPTYRKNAIHTLTELGVNDNKTIQQIIPLLVDENKEAEREQPESRSASRLSTSIPKSARNALQIPVINIGLEDPDPQEEVRKEAAVALKKLAGVDDKDKLLHLFKDMGVLSEQASRQDEDEALAALAEAVAVDEDKDLEGLAEKVKAWMASTAWTIDMDGDGFKGRRKRKEKAKTSKQPGKDGDSKTEVTNVSLPDQETNLPVKDGSRRKRKGTTAATDGSISTRTGKLLPTNPALYKTYDHQKARANTPQTEDEDEVTSGKPDTRLPAISEKHHVVADDKDEKDTGIGTDRDSDITSTFGPTSFEGPLPPLVRNDDMYATDSGIQSDDQSSQQGLTLVRRGVPHLSPIKSSGLVDTGDTKEADYPENWRDFFDRPSAQQRRRLAEQRLAAAESRGSPNTLPPIRYYDNGEQVVPPEAGVRLLHSVSVRDKVDYLNGNEVTTTNKPVRVQDMPSKLSVHTSLPSGMSKYGILNLRWTSGAGGPETELTGAPQTGLPRIKDDRLTTSMQTGSGDSTPFLPGLLGSRGNQSLEFVWQQPLPPAPYGSRIGGGEIGHEHKHYCEYYRLLKKRMNDHTSPTNPPSSGPKVAVMKLRRSHISEATVRQPEIPNTTLRMMLTCKT